MIASRRAAGASALAKEVGHWVQAEAEDRELKSRIAGALEEIQIFVTRHRSNLERRKSRLVQTTGYKDETRSREAALEKIHRLLAGRRNISVIVSAIDGFLDRYQEDETFDGDQVRTPLADASEDFVRRFRDSIGGTKLAGLLDIFYFMPYSSWRSRNVERRNFRSPSSAEVSRLLEECRRLGIEVDGIDTVQLAAMLRIKLGISPRMGYHLMPANRLAEKLTGAENIARFTSAEAPLDEGFCRTTAGILANLRRWSSECFGSAFPPPPPEIEAEQLQLVYLAGDTVRISGTGNERSADYLWLLATVVASDHAALKDVLTGFIDKHSGHPAVRERLAGAAIYLDRIAAGADAILAARWSEAKEDLGRLTVRTDAIAAGSRHDFTEFTELEALKERRSDVVKSLMKISDSIQLIEASLLDRLTPPEAPAGLLPAKERGRALDPATLRDRNRRTYEETRAIARQELEKLRLLVALMTAISRRGFANSGSPPSPLRQRGAERFACKTADGVEIAKLPDADLQAKLCGSVRKAAASLREFRGKVEAVRRRPLKSDLQHAMNVLSDKTRRAVEACDDSDPDAAGASSALRASDSLLPLLRDVMTAQASVGVRMNTVKMTPAEKQPLTALIYAMKLRLGEDLRDLERLRAELAERSAGAAVDMIPDLVFAANQALKPVKTLLDDLNSAFAADPIDRQALCAAAAALKGGIVAAREAMAAQLLRINALAAESSGAPDEHTEKFGRWRGQLSALEAETDCLLKSLSGVVALREAVATAAALEQGIADALRPPPGGRIGAEPFVPVRRRCEEALATIAELSRQAREAQDALAAARDARWRMLQPTPRALGGLWSDFTAAERALGDIQARIESTRRHFQSDRPRPR